MDRKTYQMLQEDLAKAVKEKNVERMLQLKELLNISDEQAKYFEKGLTGYATIDKVWLNYYREHAEEKANDIPTNKTVWDIIEEKLYEYYDIPALEYFGRIFSKQEFIDLCYTWARTFKAMGVKENEIIPIYGPFVPDICAMTFGLNMIGACPYFLKLAISPAALEEETKEAKIAVVYDAMWGNVANEFSKEKFKNIIVATVTADMPSPKKEIVSFINKMQSRKGKSKIPNEKKYIWTDKAIDIANYYSGDVKVPFESNRATFITSSSGTTVDGIVKGTVATNESTISQLYMGDISDIQYYPGDRCLCHFPPTASTALNMLFFVALYKGETVVLDPRVSEKDFYNQLTQLKPNMTISTGSAWEAFFNRVYSEMQAGKKFDFSYAKGWTVGGEGTDVNKIQKWDSILKKANATHMLYSGYGLSELFSAATAELESKRYDFSKQIMSVGIPYAGISMGVFDENNMELPYNSRGELRIKSKSAMKEYYKKPELTNKIIKDGWIHTGDLSEIDDKGFVYIWGRNSDKLSLSSDDIYLFDVANKIKENALIDDAIVLSMPLENCSGSLVAHIVWAKELTKDEKVSAIQNINNQLMQYLPKEVMVLAYSEHDRMLPYSPTTLKKDKNRLAHQTSGYFQVNNNEMQQVEFVLGEDNKYSIKNITKSKKKTLKK